METLSLAQGEDFAATVQLRDEQGLEIADTYTGAEPLDLDVWSGGRQAEVTLTASAATWHDAAAGQLALALGRTDTAALTAGLWFLRVWLTDGASRLLAYEARLSVRPSAGSETSLPTYGSVADLYALAPWLDQVIDQTTHLRADLGEQRARARQRIDETILASRRGDPAGPAPAAWPGRGVGRDRDCQRRRCRPGLGRVGLPRCQHAGSTGRDPGSSGGRPADRR